MRCSRLSPAIVAIALFVAQPVAASFHEMQIERVIGGINGFTDAQAIQLRMRDVNQNFVSNGRLVVRDAAGLNPVILMSPLTDVGTGNLGSRVLFATSSFSSATSPPVTPDFILTNRIPDSYLAAGSLTWESLGGSVLWRLSWGGAGYTGSGTGLTFNDADGNFNPPFAGPLPSSTDQALVFQFSAAALSTNNAADYVVSSSSATFTNNDGNSGTVISTAGVDPGPTNGVLALSAPTPNPVRSSMAYRVTLPREGNVRVRILDISGRVVRALVDQTMSAGEHNLDWSSGSAIPTGLYFLELNAAGATRTRRFVLIQ